ncbi:alcohol dehydrogenase catalytic domain-containing protein [Azoarcus sp. KH32C]|uniref:alcohol dehydrogenase catalytic domain-containing protein n=1 Tax=Azoarcus sp. KH32C TaxID=748247 RepID=UPI000238693C|nr:alcohol dehydrogenase catalytic domain-containing protein [Azoarcus sp. KH32C]BAL24271.1 alcohol dehydrogenase [Azoarcus sp. KH32C]
MKVVQFTDVGSPLKLADAPRPVAGPGELVFKVAACGVCASDLHAAEVPGMLQVGNVLGHEYSGVVAEVGPGVEGWLPGDRMIAIPVRPCGACAACRSAQYMQCSDPMLQGFDPRLPGAYAEYASCLAALAFKIPDGLGSVDAATVEPLAVGLGAWKTAQVPDGADVMIVGAGIIGLSIAKWAKFFGAGCVGVSEMVPARMERARQVGADVVIDAGACADPVAEYERQTGRKPSVIFECVGRPMIARLIAMAPIGTHLVLVGTGMENESFTVLSAAMKRLRMTFTLGYEPADFGFVLQMLGNGRITNAPMVTATIGLDELPATFEVLRKPNDHCKVVVTP